MKKDSNYSEIIELIQGKVFNKKSKYNENKILSNLYELNKLYLKKLKNIKTSHMLIF